MTRDDLYATLTLLALYAVIFVVIPTAPTWANWIDSIADGTADRHYEAYMRIRECGTQ